MSTTEHAPETEVMEDSELVYRATDPALMRFAETDAGPVLEGRMMPYNEWSEIRDHNGHYMERFAPGSLSKSLKERAARIRILFNHGLDFLGKQAIAKPDEMWDEEDGAHFRASLLPGVPELLVEGMRAGMYGSSIQARSVPGKWEKVARPELSDHNPEGIPEYTVREAQLLEFSVVTFPAYAGATAVVRSLDDEVAVRRLLRDPIRLLELIRSTNETQETEPQHSRPNATEPAEETPPADPEPQGSRSTQPTRDYLSDEEGAPTWRLPQRR